MIIGMRHDTVDRLQQDWEEQRPDLDSEPMGVVLRIQALAKKLGEQAEDSLQAFNLQWWQYDVLSALRRQGTPFVMAATELADATLLTTGAMTNRIDRLVSNKLVARQRDVKDRRRVLVRLTKKGLRVVEKATEARFQTALEAVTDLSDEQRKQLSDLLRLLLSKQKD